MNLKAVITYFLLTIDVLVFSVGTFLVFHCVKHLNEAGEASASLAHLGNISGSPHIVSLFLGIALIMSSLVYVWKMYKGLSWQEMKYTGKKHISGVTHSVTELGKMIAQMKREKRE